MSVVFHRSAGKMILKGLVIVLVFSFAWIESVAGATSYSNVYVQSGPSLASLYGPAAFRGAQYAPLAAAPLMSSLLPPCVSPCVIPSQQIAAIAPVATSSANFVSYKPSASVPVVVAPSNDDAASYEYSYVVYDENTGDQKAQQELSDGGVVRGQYSLVQPDGYVREVQYTADDIRGFNAVVKNFLPNYELKTVSEEKVLPPCVEVKKEPLKESPESESREEGKEAHDLEPEAHAEESHEGHDHGENEGHEEHAEPKIEHHEEQAETEVHEEHGEPEEPEKSNESEEQVGHEEHAEHEEHGEPEGYKKAEEHGEAEGHGVLEGHGGEEKHEEHGEHEGHEENAEPEKEGAPEEHAEPESHEEAQDSEEHKSEEKKDEPRAEPNSQEKPGEIDALVSYNDVIKCIQAAIKGVNAPQPMASPLTYIVLNKPC